MNRKAFGFLELIFVFLTIPVLGLNYLQAQSVTPGNIVRWFDADGTLTDSVITESDSGNIGIGTANPTTKLHVMGSLRVIGGVLAGPEGLPSRGIGMGYDPKDNFGVLQAINGTFFTFLVLNPNGSNVGIGTSRPMSKLHVAGRVLADGYDVLSDIRLKEDITPLTGILGKLDKIRGVSFRWNAQAEALGQATGQRDVGVIAQEVGAVFPELVTARSPENYQSVDYSKLTAVLLEAVKELRTEVSALKTENQALRQSISTLKSK